jgi:hypothetical protein
VLARTINAFESIVNVLELIFNAQENVYAKIARTNSRCKEI